jgi:hypothetical protein
MPLPLATGALPEDRIAEAARAVLADEALQRALPAGPAPDPTWLSAEPLVLLLRILLVAGLLVLAILAAVWLARRLAPGARDGALDDLAAASGPALEVRTADAQALAGAGRYGEAIHLLLLETLAALSRAARLSPALTSREVLARVALPPPALEALAGLVVAVEVSRFGGAEPGEQDYRACLDRFQAFQAGYRRAP